MKIILMLILGLGASPTLSAEPDEDTPEPLYRNGGYFGPEHSDECPPHQPSAALKALKASEAALPPPPTPLPPTPTPLPSTDPRKQASR